MTTYNHRRFIAEALDSVLGQTFSDSEIVVTDDGSTDGTLDVVATYGNAINEVLRGRNLGFSANFAKGLVHCRRELVAFLPGDDTWLPEHLTVAIDVLDSHPQAAFAYSGYERVDELLRPLPAGKMTVSTWPTGWVKPECVLANAIAPLSVVLRRSSVDSIGEVDTSLLFADIDLLIRLAKRYPVVCTGKITSRYRSRAAGMSRDQQAMSDARLALYNKHVNSCAATQSLPVAYPG